jgi:hypothetical protein
MKNIQKYIESLGIVLGLAILSQATVRTFMFWNAPQIGLFYAVKDGGLYRHAENIVMGSGAYVWSNRILSPYLLLGLTNFGWTYQTAAIIFYWCMIFINNFVFYFLLRRISVSVAASFGWLVAFNLFFIYFQDRTSHGCFYPWDMLCILFFTIFSYLAIAGKSTLWFVPLFLIAMINREDASFIALYLILSSVVIQVSKPMSVNVDKARFVIGAALLALGTWFTIWARKRFTSDLPPAGNVTHGNTVIDVKTAIDTLFIRNFNGSHDPFFFKIPDGAWLIVSVVLLMYFYLSACHIKRSLITIYILMVGSIVFFGNHLENETRLYMPLFPMFAFILARRSILEKNC